jgi:hypothetical protein
LAGERQGVWRGPEYIPLEKGLYDILRELFVLGGRPAPQTLSDMAGSSTNLNTLMSRLRVKIEPLSRSEEGDPPTRRDLYIHNRRDLGYWLENFVALAPYEKERF